ncbi:TorF family putative porin [Rudaea sp.]|uniref:TorF family putative porin n=1 Tax=Rudaea sp. TaxID=2136325 RepID=UPI002ED0D76A
MKKKYTFAILAFSISATVHAQAQSTAQEVPAYTITGNLALTSDYVFRGLTQTWGRPAIQGGADLAMANGFAAGVWASSISGRSYPGGSMELDLYASYGRAINDDWSWRAGLYGYVYPGANLDHAGLASRSLDTLEANFAVSWKLWTLKWNRALTDYFGADVEQGYRADSRGTNYFMLEGAVPLDAKWTLTLHAGYTDYSTRLAAPNVHGASDPSYADIGLGVKYQFNEHWTLLGVATHASNSRFYRDTASFQNANDTRDVGSTRGFVQLQGSF